MYPCEQLLNKPDKWRLMEDENTFGSNAEDSSPSCSRHKNKKPDKKTKMFYSLCYTAYTLFTNFLTAWQSLIILHCLRDNSKPVLCIDECQIALAYYCE